MVKGQMCCVMTDLNRKLYYGSPKVSKNVSLGSENFQYGKEKNYIKHNVLLHTLCFPEY